MPSTFTTHLNLEKPGIGEQENEWGTTLNKLTPLSMPKYQRLTCLMKTIWRPTVPLSLLLNRVLRRM
jgi:hypothetical protein